MTATLRLIPLSREECCTRLKQKGKTTSLDDVSNSGIFSSSSFVIPTATAGEYNQPRNHITLKLCEEKHCNEIIELNDNDDDHNPTPEVVRYAKRYEDGSIAAITHLGRNATTGVRWTAVSRALCDVSLNRSWLTPGAGSGGGKKAVCMVDLAASSSGRTHSQTSSSTISGESRSDDIDYNKPKQFVPPHDSGDGMAAAFLSMRKAPQQHFVFLDGEFVEKPLGREVPLPHGSIISLCGPTGFAYEVVISQNDNMENNSMDAAEINDGCVVVGETSSKKRKANPSDKTMTESPKRAKRQPQPHHEQRKRAHKLMIGEFTCAMCMDILVKSTFAYPCMHAFCEKCSRDISNAVAPSNGAHTRTSRGTCPTCRGKVEGWGAARSFDTIVWAAAMQGCFERDDAEYYLERREECGEDAPTTVERECILNDTEGGNDGGSGKSDGGKNLYLPPNPSLQQSTNLIRTLPPLFPTASNGHLNNENHGGLGGRQRPPKLGMSNDDVICID
mmetsp:Transcript_9037/g.19496  ORF Transcript_9037/g.19496 Transcript_9037/m.19496 type:complete len:503 (+) Transcript_9037:83-1591(+)